MKLIGATASTLSIHLLYRSLDLGVEVEDSVDLGVAVGLALHANHQTESTKQFSPKVKITLVDQFLFKPLIQRFITFLSFTVVFIHRGMLI